MRRPKAPQKAYRLWQATPMVKASNALVGITVLKLQLARADEGVICQIKRGLRQKP